MICFKDPAKLSVCTVKVIFTSETVVCRARHTFLKVSQAYQMVKKLGKS
jgi:hypothetical protein